MGFMIIMSGVEGQRSIFTCVGVGLAVRGGHCLVYFGLSVLVYIYPTARRELSDNIVYYMNADAIYGPTIKKMFRIQ